MLDLVLHIDDLQRPRLLDLLRLLLKFRLSLPIGLIPCVPGRPLGWSFIMHARELHLSARRM